MKLTRERLKAIIAKQMPGYELVPEEPTFEELEALFLGDDAERKAALDRLSELSEECGGYGELKVPRDSTHGT